MTADSFFETGESVQSINTEKDILLVFEKLTPSRKLLIYQSSLNPDFFDLSTGLAGQILQKLVNYQVKTAFVVNISSIKSEKFKEMAREANMGEQFRFFESREEAVEWLEEVM